MIATLVVRAAQETGYVGPPQLTWETVATEWTLDLPAVLVVLAVAVTYAGALRAAARQGHAWSPARACAFLSGLVVAVLATCSVLGVYSRVLFWVFTVQVSVLLLVVPMLLGVGGPVALAVLVTGRTSPPRALRVLRMPGAGPLLLIIATAVLFFTPVLEVSLSRQAAFHTLHLLLVLVGLAMVLPVTDDGVRLSSLAYAAMLGAGFVEFLLDAVPGIALRLHGSVLAQGYWLSVGRPWGPSLLGDQQLAGSWLWFFGEAADLPFLLALVVAWIRSDAAEAKEHDRLDDERRQAAAARDAAAGTQEQPDQEGTRPWWESDPSVFGEHRARRNGWGDGRR